MRSKRLVALAALILVSLVAQACSSGTAEQTADRVPSTAAGDSDAGVAQNSEDPASVEDEERVDREGDAGANAGPDATPAPEPASGPNEAISYLAPRPDGILVSAGTTIAVRSGSTIDAASLNDTLITATGADSGPHEGTVLLADDDQTVIFAPNEPFTDGETVTVSIEPGITTESGLSLQAQTYNFHVSPPLPTVEPPSPPPAAATQNNDDEAEETERAVSALGTSVSRDYVTIPETFPHLIATVTTEAAADGVLLLGNHQRRPPNPFVLIAEDNGDPIFFRALTPGLRHPDFKVLAPGLLSYFDWANGVYQIMDDSYRLVRTVQAGNGYQIDSHGIHLNDNGNILLQIYDDRPFDMSEVVAGGLPNALVKGAVVQELDASGNVIFEWRSWDHFDVTDATANIDLTSELPDVTHINSIEWDHTDGNIIISNRHMDEISKIDRQTGDVIWRMGGKNNQFTFIDEDRAFSHQHDARRLDNGNLTLYDNGNLNDPQYSRAVEYELDEVNLTATKVWEYRNQPADIFGFATGAAQRLENGNTLIAWGGAGVGGIRPILTEVDPDGNKTVELHFLSNESSYRVFREQWQARPFAPPTLATSGSVGNQTLHYSWNGATDVQEFEVYGGPFAAPAEAIETVAKVGFETASAAPAATAVDGCYFYRVGAVATHRSDVAYSNPIFAGDSTCERVLSLTATADTSATMASVLRSPRSTATVRVPAAALEAGTATESAVLFYVDRQNPILAAGSDRIETGVVFDLYGQVDGKVVPSLRLAQPVAVDLTYVDDVAAIAADGQLQVLGWDAGTQTWTAEGIAVVASDDATNSLSFNTDRLTQIGLFVVNGDSATPTIEDTDTDAATDSTEPSGDGIELIQSGGFEGSAEGWAQTSSNVPNLVCDGGCSYDGIPQTNSGNQWVFFGGGFTKTEKASVSQQISVPDGETVASATMTFWLRIPDSGGDVDETVSVMLDDQVLLTIDATQSDQYRQYTEVALDLTDLVTGDHVVSINAMVQPSSLSSFYIDDVSVLINATNE